MGIGWKQRGKPFSKMASGWLLEPLLTENVSEKGSQKSTSSGPLTLFMLLLSDWSPKWVPRVPKTPAPATKSCPKGYPRGPKYCKNGVQTHTCGRQPSSHTSAAGCREANRIIITIFDNDKITVSDDKSSLRRQV